MLLALTAELGRQNGPGAIAAIMETSRIEPYYRAGRHAVSRPATGKGVHGKVWRIQRAMIAGEVPGFGQERHHDEPP